MGGRMAGVTHAAKAQALREMIADRNTDDAVRDVLRSQLERIEAQHAKDQLMSRDALTRTLAEMRAEWQEQWDLIGRKLYEARAVVDGSGVGYREIAVWRERAQYAEALGRDIHALEDGLSFRGMPLSRIVKGIEFFRPAIARLTTIEIGQGPYTHDPNLYKAVCEFLNRLQDPPYHGE